MSTSSDVRNRFATPKNPTKASERSISCNHCISSKYKTNVCETITVKFEYEVKTDYQGDNTIVSLVLRQNRCCQGRQ